MCDAKTVLLQVTIQRGQLKFIVDELNKVMLLENCKEIKITLTEKNFSILPIIQAKSIAI